MGDPGGVPACRHCPVSRLLCRIDHHAVPGSLRTGAHSRATRRRVDLFSGPVLMTGSVLDAGRRNRSWHDGGYSKSLADLRLQLPVLGFAALALIAVRRKLAVDIVGDDTRRRLPDLHRSHCKTSSHRAFHVLRRVGMPVTPLIRTAQPGHWLNEWLRGNRLPLVGLALLLATPRMPPESQLDSMSMGLHGSRAWILDATTRVVVPLSIASMSTRSSTSSGYPARSPTHV